MRAPARIYRLWRNLPFAQKLAALLIALVSVPIIVVVLFTTYTSREAQIAATRARNLQRAQATAQVIDAFFNDARADVRSTSALSAVVDLCEGPDQPGRLQPALQSLRAVRSEQRMMAMYVTDRAGRVLASTDARVQTGTLQAGRTFLSALAGDTVVDEPRYEPYDQRVAVRVSHAVRSAAGDIIGTTTGLVDVAAIDALTHDDEDYGRSGEFGVLWTSVGVRLSQSGDNTHRFESWTPLASDTEVTTRQRLGPAYATAASFDPGYAPLADRGQWLLYDAGTDPHLRIETRDRGALQVTAVPLRGQRWIYAIFVPEERLFAQLRNQMLPDWAVAFFTVLAALTLSVIAARWVTQPLRLVKDTANALASGDMTRRVRLDQEDELGQLGVAFDAMAAALADKERQLQAHAADLEQRVEERTATLQLFERASRTLASSLELRRTGVNLATLLVPAIADFCCIDVRDFNGHLRRIVSRHAEASRERLANELMDVRPLRDPVVALSSEERAALGLKDVRVYELSAGRQIVGHLTVGMGVSRQFSERDEQVFDELGRRAGLALANALLYQEAQDANRLKDEFLGVVSHELRTPLNAIMGWSRLAGMSRDAGIDAHKALEAVERNARALTRLVDDLLDVPRIMMGKLTLDLRPVDLVAIVNTAVDAIHPAAAAKSLRVDVRSDVPTATVDADPQRLQQVFGNILSNAVKFTPAGGRITVRVGHSQNVFTIAFEDTGIGIGQDFLPFVFDRFRQADSSTTRAHGGLGIGLALVRHLVEMHGGRVSAASDGPGRGSVFLVQLPIAYGEPHVDASADWRSEGAALDRLRGMRLLLVDDDEDARAVVRELLEASGATVRSSTSVADAVAILDRDAPAFDAVLADIGMPGEDGYALIAHLRAAPDTRLRTLPVVAVTAYASRSDRAKAIAAGFDAHVAKPVSLIGLAEGLAEAAAVRAHR